MMAEPETRKFLHRLRGKHGQRIQALAEKVQKVAIANGGQVPSMGGLRADLVNLCIVMGLNEFEKMDTQRLRDLLEMADA